MRVRHKPPTLVSMWMLDVFCCALGCVTLLFLLNSRMAGDAVQASRAAQLDLATADQRLAASITALETTRLKLNAEEEERGRLAASVTELEGVRLKMSDESRQLAEQLKTARAEKDATARKLATARDDIKIAQAQLDATQLALNAAEKKVDVTAKERDASRKQVADATDLLKKKQKDIDALATREAAGAAQLESLRRLVRTKDEERLSLEARMTATRRQLTDLEARTRMTQKDLDAQLAAARAAAKAAADELAAAKAAAAKTGEELAATRAQLKDLTKEVDDANVTIIDLQGTNAKLADRFNKVQRETEARFAGIAMTGKRVAFLVDMSGSMGKRDLSTLDDTKWPLVIETVCKVMRSIPTLEQYQVVTFSGSANWVFGSGEWQKFDGEKSVETVKAALLRVRPRDDTNMHAALEKAFSLRASGLDTIYLFSDGLPTSGPNLTAAQLGLPESERGVILAKHLRETLDRSWNRAEPGRPRVRINSVGFYFDSPDVGAFLWSLSRDNDGSFVGMSRP
ncbi:MAG: VWA domain-containing protein [Planctomycetes bacterium]|nr:VWA domain-containing protein [Planctomycetota bacterium]